MQRAAENNDMHEYNNEQKSHKEKQSISTKKWVGEISESTSVRENLELVRHIAGCLSQSSQMRLSKDFDKCSLVFTDP